MYFIFASTLLVLLFNYLLHHTMIFLKDSFYRSNAIFLSLRRLKNSPVPELELQNLGGPESAVFHLFVHPSRA